VRNEQQVFARTSNLLASGRCRSSRFFDDEVRYTFGQIRNDYIRLRYGRSSSVTAQEAWTIVFGWRSWSRPRTTTTTGRSGGQSNHGAAQKQGQSDQAFHFDVFCNERGGKDIFAFGFRNVRAILMGWSFKVFPLRKELVSIRIRPILCSIAAGPNERWVRPAVRLILVAWTGTGTRI
jgi:hypothetical protein